MKTNSAAKRFLAIFLCIVFCFALLPSAAFAEEADAPVEAQVEAAAIEDTELPAETLTVPAAEEINGDTVPALPTATVTELTPATVQVDGKNVVLDAEYRFSAVEPTAEQLAYYGNWNADYRVSMDADTAAKSFGLYGEYSGYGQEFKQGALFPDAMEKDKPAKLLERANLSGVTYNDLVNNIGEFTCGVWNESAENIGKTITVELVIWDPTAPDTTYTVATENYTFEEPPYPEASIEPINPEKGVPIFDIDTRTDTGETADLEAEYKFTQAKEPTELQLSYYGSWGADFRVSFDRPVAASTVGLYGAYDYDGWGYDLRAGFLNPEGLAAGQKIKLLSLANFNLNYTEIVNIVQAFTCGVWNESPDNYGTTITVELVIWDPDDDTNEHVVTTESYTFKGPQTPKLPTATVKAVENPRTGVPLYDGSYQQTGETADLESEYVFTPDAPTEEQLAYYGNWHADFRIRFDADLAANSFGLAGAYNGYGREFNVGFLFPQDVKKGEPIQLMETAGFTGPTAITYKDLVNNIKVFNCGVFNKSVENCGKTITVELILWDPNAPETTYLINSTSYTFKTPDLPTAKVEAVENPRTGVPLYNASYEQTGETADLEAEYVFTPDAPTDLQLAYYRNWAADFRISFDADLAANSFGLAGAYNGYGHEFNVGFLFPRNVTAGEKIQLMESAGFTGNKVITYNDLVNNIKVFNCGVFNRSVDNIGKTITVELILWNPQAPDTVYVVNTTDYTFQGATLELQSQDTQGNTGIAALTGGGVFFKGAQVTVTAGAADGYSFAGWHIDSASGELVSADAEYSFKISADMKLVAVYESAGTGLLHIKGSKYEVDDSGLQESSHDFDVPVGKQVTLVYKDTDFQYWVNISDNIVSTSPTYVFTMVGETTIKLVTSRNQETEPSAYVIFLNAYDQVLSAQRVIDDISVETVFPKTNPSKMGVIFEKWVFEGTEDEATEAAILAKMSSENPVVKIVPQYKEPQETYTLTVKVKIGDGNATDVEGMSKLEIPAGTSRNVTVSEIAAKAELDAGNFSFWSLDDGTTPTSYNKTEYTVIAAAGQEITLTAAFGQNAEEKPTIAITQMFGTNPNGVYKVSATMRYYVPDGFTVHESGFVFSKTEVTSEELIIGADNVKKHISNMISQSAIYTVNIKTSGADQIVYLKAFVIYTDKNGNLQTIYTDMMQGSYNSLAAN